MSELDFGKDSKRVDFAIDAAYQVGALLTLLMRADDSNNLMECMSILGPKLQKLVDLQVSALNDEVVTLEDLKAMLNGKEVSHV